MLKLKQMKDKQAAEAAASSSSSSSSAPLPPKEAGKAPEERQKTRQRNASELIVQRDVNELPHCPGVEVTFPDPNDLMKFQISVVPEEGLYAGGKFRFSVEVPDEYPFKPPKVHCDTLIYHPNIDLEGHVCLNILRQEWSPALNLGSVIFGILFLFSVSLLPSFSLSPSFFIQLFCFRIPTLTILLTGRQQH